MARRLVGVKRLVFSFGFAIVAKALAAVFATYPTHDSLPGAPPPAAK